MKLKLKSGKRLKKCSRLKSDKKVTYWVSKYKAVVRKITIAFFINLFLPKESIGQLKKII